MGDNGEVVQPGQNLVDGKTALKAENMSKRACTPKVDADGGGSGIVKSKINFLVLDLIDHVIVIVTCHFLSLQHR